MNRTTVFVAILAFVLGAYAVYSDATLLKIEVCGGHNSCSSFERSRR